MAELLFQLALTLVPNIGPVQAKILLQQYDVEDIFKAKKSQLEKLEGIGFTGIIERRKIVNSGLCIDNKSANYVACGKTFR